MRDPREDRPRHCPPFRHTTPRPGTGRRCAAPSHQVQGDLRRRPGPAFSGTRTLYGGDARWTHAHWLATGTLIASRLEFSGGGVAADQDLLVAGFNAWPTRPIEFQVDLLLDVNNTALGRQRLAAGGQVSF